jgi:hypothetical protein
MKPAVPMRGLTAKRVGVGCATALLAATLSGCGGASFASMSPDLPEVDADPSPVAAKTTTKPLPTAAPRKEIRTPSDLELGSHTSKSQAGPLSIVIDYWTDQPASSWYGQPALVNFTLRVARDVGETSVKISRMRVTADGKSVLLEDSGEFAV